VSVFKEDPAKDARRMEELRKMNILERPYWPHNAEADGKLYRLECSVSKKLPEGVQWDFDTDLESLLVPLDPDPFPQPTLSPVEGSYRNVAKVATRLNRDQERMGVVTYRYFPVLIEPQKVA
jgi:hypothetical protein